MSRMPRKMTVDSAIVSFPFAAFRSSQLNPTYRKAQAIVVSLSCNCPTAQMRAVLQGTSLLRDLPSCDAFPSGIYDWFSWGLVLCQASLGDRELPHLENTALCLPQ